MTNELLNVVQFEENKHGRDFIIGDLHGSLKAFNKILQAIDFNKDIDRMFSVGDLIDRGEDSDKCLMLLDQPWFHAVRGNHEVLMWDSIIHKSWNDYDTWMYNGGKWAQQLVHDFPGILEELCKKYISKMPLIIVVGSGESRFNIVHGELYSSNRTLSDHDIDHWTFIAQEEHDMIWGRNAIHWPSLSDGKQLHNNMSPTYVGHTPLRKVVTVGAHHYIDQGAVFGEKASPGISTNLGLTVVEHKTRQFITYHPSAVNELDNEFTHGTIPTAEETKDIIKNV